MSLFDEVSSLMHESLTLHRFLPPTSQRGVDTFSPTTEDISPVRLTRREEVMFDDNGKEVRTRGRILMPMPISGSVAKKDKLVMAEGEIFRVFSIRQTRDAEGLPYLSVIVT